MTAHFEAEFAVNRKLATVVEWGVYPLVRSGIVLAIKGDPALFTTKADRPINLKG